MEDQQTGLGKCGVAVIRISGEQAQQGILKMTSSEALPSPRKAVLRHIINPTSGEVLDKGLVLWFPAPRSFTGEDSVEFHIHGGPAVCKAVLSALGKLPDFTPAQPGDFTKRAFYNSKLDLTSVEGLGDLIHAETEAQRKQAFKQMEGSLCEIYTEWREIILKARANIEAYIDFSEDENLEKGVLLDVRHNLVKLVKDISNHLADSRKGERLKSGLNLAILGRPNVGKSSFLNAVVQRPAAIVSSIPGTTRDVVEVALDLGGYPVNISDTAGLRNTKDTIEKEGIERALYRVKHADIALIIVDASELFVHLESSRKRFDLGSFLFDYFRQLDVLGVDLSPLGTLSGSKYEWLVNGKYVILSNKIDLLESKSKTRLLEKLNDYENIYLVSLKTFEGLDLVLNKMKTVCADLCGSDSLAESPYLTSERQKTHIGECFKHLKTLLGQPIQDTLGINSNDKEPPTDLLLREETLVLAAQRLRFASTQLGYVTGHITNEEVLDHIFSSFCIGK